MTAPLRDAFPIGSRVRLNTRGRAERTTLRRQRERCGTVCGRLTPLSRWILWDGLKHRQSYHVGYLEVIS